MFFRLAGVLRRVPAKAAAAGLALHSANVLARAEPTTPHKEDWHKVEGKSLPIISRAELSKHMSPETGIWVSFRGAVYDITSFVANHPGGVEKIMTAAGQSVEPFWGLYRQHLMPKNVPGASTEPTPKDHVAEILAPLQVGWLDPAEAASEKARSPDDPYAKEPARHPALQLLSETPCSAESPASLMHDSWITPNELWFVRNHHPVPILSEDGFTLEVGGLGVAPRALTMADLRSMPKAEVTATLQCGGNRRGGLDEVRKTSGNAWGVGAVSNATWTGVRLSDVLRACGLDLNDPAVGAELQHVHFEGDDGTRASIPSVKALSPQGDVLLAYEMNGEPLPADHGFPLRAVVPGHVGVRNIKWLKKVTTSAVEAEGVWQRGMAYKVFNPSVRKLDGIDVESYAAMQEMPVQSVILSPQPHAKADPDDESVTVRGFAWSGGGRGIVRVDVSADGGSSWVSAELGEGSEQPRHRAWAWTFWEAEVPLPAAGAASLVCKATDAAHNVQPESAESIWNLRGLANNSWHRVPIEVADVAAAA